jgi:rod shape determining protein RodA
LFELDQLVIVFTILGWALYNVLYSNRKTFIISTLILGGVTTAYLLLNYPDYYLLIAIELAAVALFLYNAFNREIKDRWDRNGVISIFIIALGFIFTVGFIFTNVLQEHQRTRITVLLGEEDKLREQITALQEQVNALPVGTEVRKQAKSDLRSKKESLDKLKRGAGWNVNQSKIAIGSGGIVGKGFLQGTQTKYDFVPEQSTDFIFCTVGEEWGFVGSFIVVSLFVALLVRLIVVAERQRSRFTRIYGYAVASIFFFHFAINIAMTLGLAPVIGIPLPFLSYGGSSLWAFTILLFIFLKLDSERMTVLR